MALSEKEQVLLTLGGIEKKVLSEPIIDGKPCYSELTEEAERQPGTSQLSCSLHMDNMEMDGLHSTKAPIVTQWMCQSKAKKAGYILKSSYQECLSVNCTLRE